MTSTTHPAAIPLMSDALTAAAVHLYLHSALNYCTELTEPAPIDGAVRLAARWHPCTFSTGERVLWDALSVLSHRECEADYDGVIDFVSPHLDTRNKAALAVAVEMWEAAR